MTDTFDEKSLNTLLSEPLSSVYEREKSTFDRLAAPFENSLVLFGAGGLGRKTLLGLRQIGLEPLCFADNNPDLWGKEINGLNVMSLSEAVARYGEVASFVITIWKGEATDTMSDRQQQLKDLNCPRVIPFSYLYWKYGDVFLPHYAFDMPHKVFNQADEVNRAFYLWEDGASRKEYLSQVRWRVLMDFDGLNPPVEHEIYFPSDLLTILPDEVFIDCGAYDGDTVRSLLNAHESYSGEIIAFEPDPSNFLKLKNYIEDIPSVLQDKMEAYPFAVGSTRSKVRFEAAGTEASAVGSGDFEVECVTLDEILAEKKTTYIKMDIEGSELDALAGAKKTIQKNLPVLAVCSYHRQDHLWKIPNLISTYSKQYRFFLRPHLLEVWDLVCYAIPVDRLKPGR
jgi:FkbM family methyltransferase